LNNAVACGASFIGVEPGSTMPRGSVIVTSALGGRSGSRWAAIRVASILR
jgi:hypothetical protein